MKPSKQEVELYKAWLRSARTEESSTAIPNELPWHSRCAVSELTQLAIDKQRNSVNQNGEPVCIRLFTGTVAPFVYNERWVKAVTEFLELGGQLRVLLWNQEVPPETMKALGPVLECDDVEIRVSRTRTRGEKLNHFFVVDEQAFRKEAPHPYCHAGGFSETSPEIPAQICFNDREQAHGLVDYFDAIWDACRPMAELCEAS